MNDPSPTQAWLRALRKLTEADPESVGRVASRIRATLSEDTSTQVSLRDLPSPSPTAVRRVKFRLQVRCPEASRGWLGRLAVVASGAAAAAFAFALLRGGLFPPPSSDAIGARPSERAEGPAATARTVLDRADVSSGEVVARALPPSRRLVSPRRQPGKESRLENIRSFGQIDRDRVEAQLAPLESALAGCGRGLSHPLEISIIIDGEGAFGGVKVSGVSLETEACITDVLAGIRFDTGSVRAGLEEQVTGGVVRFTFSRLRK